MSTAMVLVLLAAVAAGAALAELVGPAARHGRRRRAATAAVAAKAPEPVVHARWAARAGVDERTERLLDAAGRGVVPDAEALAGRRRVGAAVGATWALALGMLVLPAGVAIGGAFVGAGIGRAFPGLVLQRDARRRAAALGDELPELLDLLAVGLGCGLPLRGALTAIGEWGDGPLAAAAGRAARELAHGAGTQQTLTRLVRDHPVTELEAAVAILERARTHGAPAAEPLRVLAAGARQARARRAMDHAAKAAPRIQLVAALLLVPAALCVLAAGLVAGGLST